MKIEVNYVDKPAEEIKVKRKQGFATVDKETLREWAKQGGSAKVPKGFACMPIGRLREVSSKGGKNGHR